MLIDLGVSFPKVNKSIEYKISHICGAVVSHVHKDHAEYIPVFASNSVEVYSNANVREIRLNTALTLRRVSDL